MIVAVTTSAEGTRALAEAVAPLVRAGDIVVLAGELGAGKTAFAQGFGRGLGVKERITSPTFTLARHYAGRLDLHHIDVYRLDHLAELFDVGLPEVLDEGGVTLIEWGDVVIPALPADFLEVRLAFEDGDETGSDEDRRTVTFRPVGPRWAARVRALREAVAAWSGPC